MPRMVIPEVDSLVLAKGAVLNLTMSADIAKERDIGPINVCNERKMKKGKTYMVDLLTPQLVTCRILELMRLAVYSWLWDPMPMEMSS